MFGPGLSTNTNAASAKNKSSFDGIMSRALSFPEVSLYKQLFIRSHVVYDVKVFIDRY
jgi:hypothetical protein